MFLLGFGIKISFIENTSAFNRGCKDITLIKAGIVRFSHLNEIRSIGSIQALYSRSRCEEHICTKLTAKGTYQVEFDGVKVELFL